MTYDEFALKCAAIDGVQIEDVSDPERRERYSWEKPPKTSVVDGCRVQWSTGGTSGGSYLDSSNPQPYHTNDPEPAFEALDAILINICPDISFLRYRQVEKVVQRGDYHESEYYGNGTDWMVKWFTLRDLYDALDECGVFK